MSESQFNAEAHNAAETALFTKVARAQEEKEAALKAAQEAAGNLTEKGGVKKYKKAAGNYEKKVAEYNDALLKENQAKLKTAGVKGVKGMAKASLALSGLDTKMEELQTKFGQNLSKLGAKATQVKQKTSKALTAQLAKRSKTKPPAKAANTSAVTEGFQEVPGADLEEAARTRHEIEIGGKKIELLVPDTHALRGPVKLPLGSTLITIHPKGQRVANLQIKLKNKDGKITMDRIFEYGNEMKLTKPKGGNKLVLTTNPDKKVAYVKKSKPPKAVAKPKATAKPKAVATATKPKRKPKRKLHTQESDTYVSSREGTLKHYAAAPSKPLPEAELAELQEKMKRGNGLSVKEAIKLAKSHPNLDFLRPKWKCACCGKEHTGLLRLEADAKSRGTKRIRRKLSYKFNEESDEEEYGNGRYKCARYVSRMLGLEKNSGEYGGLGNVTYNLAPALMKANLEASEGTSAGLVFGIEYFEPGDVIIFTATKFMTDPDGKEYYGHEDRTRENGSIVKENYVRFNHTGIVRDVVEVDGVKYIALQEERSGIELNFIPIERDSKKQKAFAKKLKTKTGRAELVAANPRLESILQYRDGFQDLIRVRTTFGWNDVLRNPKGRIAFAIRTQNIRAPQRVAANP